MSLVVATAAMAAAGGVFGMMELYAAAAAAVAALVLAVLWVQLAWWQLTVDRQLGNLRAGVGDDILVSLRLTNRSRHDSPALRLQDAAELAGGWVDLAVGPLRPSATVRGSYRLRATARGAFRLGPLACVSTDPFGLAQRVRVLPGTSKVVVHPSVETLDIGVTRAASEHLPSGAKPALGQSNDEFSSLREYRPGDDVRRLHWRSTARTDTLMVREEQLLRRGQLTVLVDLRAGVWRRAGLERRDRAWRVAGLERSLVAAASIAVAAADDGLAVRLITTAGVDTGAGSGPSHRARILDELAEAQLHDGQPVAPNRGRGRPIANASRRDTTDTLVVVGVEGASNGLGAVSGVNANARAVYVVLEGAARDAHAPHPVGRVVRVGPEGIAAAWAKAWP
ncbi:MAG TPA: DUF58 domain-containing protein [Acidimicrobiales bacterium]|nr:DUF58 domain-containing protein [Acidimicrobiales bacterium]